MKTDFQYFPLDFLSLHIESHYFKSLTIIPGGGGGGGDIIRGVNYGIMPKDRPIAPLNQKTGPLCHYGRV